MGLDADNPAPEVSTHFVSTMDTRKTEDTIEQETIVESLVKADEKDVEMEESEPTQDSAAETESTANKNNPRKRLSTASWMENPSDADLYISSLKESLMMHKEIVERIENEKEQYIEAMTEKQQKERDTYERALQSMQFELDQQRLEAERLRTSYHALQADLEKKKQEYNKMEANYYSYLRQIRATDDDLSTIQVETSHLLSQISNMCMSLRSKLNRKACTEFVEQRWPDLVDALRKKLLETDDTKDENDATVELDSGYLGLLVEKFIVETIIERILSQPIHPGLSVNEAFSQVQGWMQKRNSEWAARLRQQMSALAVKQLDDEAQSVKDTIDKIIQDLVDQITQLCNQTNKDAGVEKKIQNIITRAAKLNLAIKGQELPVTTLTIEEGVAEFNGDRMKAASKGKSEGTVFAVISPPFTASDPADPEHGFTVPAKVLCL